MSDTPRTDDEAVMLSAYPAVNPSETPVVHADFARQLERELAAKVKILEAEEKHRLIVEQISDNLQRQLGERERELNEARNDIRILEIKRHEEISRLVELKSCAEELAKAATIYGSNSPEWDKAEQRFNELKGKKCDT